MDPIAHKIFHVRFHVVFYICFAYSAWDNNRPTLDLGGDGQKLSDGDRVVLVFVFNDRFP